MAALLIFWTIFFLGILSLFTRLLNQLWLKPRRIRSVLWKQGIRGPQPSFLFGNTAEMEKIRSTADITQKASKGRHVQHDWAPSVHPFLHKWANEYGPVYMYSTGSQQHLVVSDPQLIRELRSHNSMDLGRPTYMNKNFQALTGDSFLVANGEKWAYQRKIIAPEFFLDKVKDMLGLMVKSTTTTIKAWEKSIQESDSGIMDMRIDEDLKAISREVLSRACFGGSYSKGNQIFATISVLEEALSEPNVFFGFLNLRFFPTENDKKIKSLKKEVDDLILKLVRDRQVEMRRDGASQKDLLQIILESAANSSDMPAQLKSDRFILDTCKSMYFAGAQTTAIAVAWTLMLLSLHQEWQERIRAEIVEVCGDHDLHQCLQHIDTLSKLKTLTMVIQESLRLYPPATITAKHALADMKLGELEVPGGTNIWIFAHRLHRDPENWGPDANEFKPERFANGVTKSCKYTQAYVPFGFGARICIGQKFAMTQIKIVLSLILSKFSFSISPNYHHSPVSPMLLLPEHGIRLLVSPVQAKANSLV
ncbi:hypothetical protein ABKV19_021750 [Rosa sericea]